MNRKQRRADTARMRKVGDVIRTETIRVVTDKGAQFYWFGTPQNFSPDDAQHLMDWFRGLHAEGPGVDLHGPFKTDDEAKKNQHEVLLGPECKIIPGGTWDPNWDKPQ
jgi:hypothetical protein